MPAIQLTVPRSGRVSKALLITVGALIALNLIGQVSKYELGFPNLKGFVPTFDVDLEPTVPTWYSSTALALAGLLLAIIAAAKYKTHDNFRWHWAFLCGLFLLLSMDEIAGFHERLVRPLRQLFNASGLFYYTWVIPGAVGVFILSCLYFRFFLNLPRETQIWFFLAAALYVGGALGVEMIGGALAERTGEENLYYALVVTVEESMEMLGVVLFIYGLLSYIESHLQGLQIQFSEVAAELKNK